MKYSDLDKMKVFSSAPTDLQYNLIDTPVGYTIAAMLPGYNQHDVEVIEEERCIVINLAKSDPFKRKHIYLHQSFEIVPRTYRIHLQEYMRAVKARYDSGILYINIERIVPAEQYPNRISLA